MPSSALICARICARICLDLYHDLPGSVPRSARICALICPDLVEPPWILVLTSTACLPLTQELLRQQQGPRDGEERYEQISKFLNDTEEYLNKLASKVAMVRCVIWLFGWLVGY